MKAGKSNSNHSGGSHVQKGGKGSVYGGTSSGQTRHTDKITSSVPVGKPPVKK